MARLRASAFPLSLLVAASMAACGPGAPTASPSSGPSPTPAASGAAFTLQVVPAASIGRTIPGARVVFLVTVTGAAADGPAQITVQAPNTHSTVEPAQLLPGVVGEVTVVPIDCPCDGVTVGVAIAAERDGLRQVETRNLELAAGTDTWAAEAAAHLAPFVTWLEANRPELGITSKTKWEGTPGSWVLIVEHYLYFSTDWELDLSWHVMVPPDDWSRISLRHRGTEVAPSLAFEISSVAGKTTPKEIAPPDAVWR
jgi:hypothetical protein